SERMSFGGKERERRFRHDTNAVGDGDNSRLDLCMPFASVRLLTRATPDLYPPPGDPFNKGGLVFVPYVGGAPFPFKILTVDLEGNIAEFSGPLLFMERDHNVRDDPQNGIGLKSVLEHYNKGGTSQNPVPRKFDWHGQRVAYADGQAPDDTVLATQSVAFKVVRPPHLANISQDEPRFLPLLDEARAVVPAMSALTGAATPTRLSYPAHYAEHGFTGNAAEVFLEVPDAPKLSFAGQGDRSGGFVTPSLDVSGLSRLTGPIGGNVADAVAGNSFDIAKYFDAAGAKLFGLISLSELLPKSAFSPDKVPAFVAQTLDVASTLKQNVGRLQVAAQQQAAVLGAAGTTLAADIGTLLNDLTTLASNPDAPLNLSGDLQKIAGDLAPFIAAVNAAPGLPTAQKQQLVAIATRVQDQLTDAAAVAQALVQFAKGMKLPDVVNARLDWSTDLNPWTGAKPIFQPTNPDGSNAAKGRLTLA